MTSLLLGLDGGGTQTRAALADAGGAVLSRGGAGACNLAAVAPADALAAALAAADAALAGAGRGRAGVSALCAGVAGVSHPERRALFLAGLRAAFPAARVAVEPDYAVALAGAAGGGPGVIVIAGTGSVAYGEDASGEGHKAGGYGFLIDDAGSGYGVGRAALAAVLRAADGTGEATTLSGRITGALRLSAPGDLIPGVYGGGLDRAGIAGLSRVVADAAREDDDPVARALLMRAGGALARLADAVTRRLFPSPESAVPVFPVGGLWDAGDALRETFTLSLRRFAPAAVLVPPHFPPVEGALLRARRLRPDAEKS